MSADDSDDSLGAPAAAPINDLPEDAPDGGDALAEQVAARIRDMVIRGQLQPGERIVERRLCLSLGVSRTGIPVTVRTYDEAQ